MLQTDFLRPDAMPIRLEQTLFLLMEIVLECWRSGFVSGICFLRVCLVSGVFGCLDGDIYLLACP